MKRFKKIPALVLCPLFLFSLLLAAPAQAKDTQTLFIESASSSLPIQWSTSFFDKASTSYQPELSKSALALSSAAYDLDLLKKAQKALGFSSSTYYNYRRKSTAQSNRVAYVIGHQQIKNQQDDYYLIDLVIRGTVEKEWASNFRVSMDSTVSDEHYGFSEAAKSVLSSLEAYLDKYPSINATNSKILITGHSRGGAVANLLAKTLSKEEMLFSSKNLYAYSFAAPNSSKNIDNSHCDNLFNLVNPADIVTEVPPSAWGFSRYGQTISLPSSGKAYEAQYALMCKNYEALTGQPYAGKRDDGAQAQALLERTLASFPNAEAYCSKNFINGQSLQSFLQRSYSLWFGQAGSLQSLRLQDIAGYAELLKTPFFRDASTFFLGEQLLQGKVDRSRTASHNSDVYFSWLLALDEQR